MKLKVKLEKFPTGTYYYTIYKRVFPFFWVEIGGHNGLYHTKEEACSVALQILQQASKELKNKKEPPVFFELQSDGGIVRSE